MGNNGSEIAPVMGKLLDGKRRRGTRITRDDIFQKANILSFEGLTACVVCHPAKCFFYHVTVGTLQRAH